ncbi:MAG: phage holin family protein, partial [Lachnospirales bacterium]
LWHKAGCVAAVTISGILDLVVGQILTSLPTAALPFSYTVFLCPLVVIWYILTEVGSIVENAGAMGAPLPGWLKQAVAVLRDQVEPK